MRKMISLTSIMALIVLIMIDCPDSMAAPKATPEKTRESWESEWNKTVEAAKQEGKVVLYSTPSGDVIRDLAGAFEKKFGIKVDWINGRGEELAERMQTEKVAGMKGADVILSGGTTTQTVMKPRGLLGKIDSLLMLPEVKDPKAYVNDQVPFLDKDHTGMALLATFQRYVVRNTTLVQANEITSYTDLLNPKWKGKITSNDPQIAGTASAFFTMLVVDLWGVEKTKEFMRQFVKQQPVITRDRRLQAEWVARGKYALSVATNFENAIEFISLGSPIDFCRVKEGGKMGPGAGGLAIPLSPAHPNASKVFVNWLLSTEGHRVFVKAYGSPGIRKDAPKEGIPPQMFPDPGEKVILDDEKAILYRDEITKISKEIFAPLFK